MIHEASVEHSRGGSNRGAEAESLQRASSSHNTGRRSRERKQAYKSHHDSSHMHNSSMHSSKLHASEDPSRRKVNKSRRMEEDHPDRMMQEAYAATAEADNQRYLNANERVLQNQSKISSIAKGESFNKSMNSSSLD